MTIRRWLSLSATMMIAVVPMAMAAELDRIELSGTDSEAAATWYAGHFDGVREGTAVRFGTVTLSWSSLAEGARAAHPSIAHLGFSVADVEAKLAELERSGVKVLKGLHTQVSTRWAIVSDPEGLAVGLLEDPELPGFHHLMLNSPLTERQATLAWYREVLGAGIEHLQNAPLWAGVRANNAWILFVDDKSAAEPKNYQGAAVTWRVADADAAQKIYESRRDSEELAGEGLAIVDPSGLTLKFVKDAAAVMSRAVVPSPGSGTVEMSEEAFRAVAEYPEDFTIEIVRVLGQDACTLGQVYVNGIGLGFVLELPWKGNKPTISAIPAGTYSLTLRHDSKERLRIHVEGVPGRAGIQMHVGTTPDDTHGCILLGTGVAPEQCRILNTREAFNRLERAYFGTNEPEKMALDRPARLKISDSITSGAPETIAP